MNDRFRKYWSRINPDAHYLSLAGIRESKLDNSQILNAQDITLICLSLSINNASRLHKRIMNDWSKRPYSSSKIDDQYALCNPLFFIFVVQSMLMQKI